MRERERTAQERLSVLRRAVEVGDIPLSPVVKESIEKFTGGKFKGYPHPGEESSGGKRRQRQ